MTKKLSEVEEAYMSITLIMALAFMVVSSFVEPQSIPSCASKLAPCFGYLNSKNPPNICCKPLREAFATQLHCLCNIFAAPGLFQKFEIRKCSKVKGYKLILKYSSKGVYFTRKFNLNVIKLVSSCCYFLSKCYKSLI